jgi:hypothetical protein
LWRKENVQLSIDLQNERLQFQRETLRTSDLYRMLDKILKRLHDLGCRAEDWPKRCLTCDLMIEAKALMEKPLNAPPTEAEKVTK